MIGTLLVINAGSSSVKFQLFAHQKDLPLLCRGKVAEIGGAPVFTGNEGKAATEKKDLPASITHEDALRIILNWVETHENGGPVMAAGHRVVHGGAEFTQPIQITPAVLDKLGNLSPLAPLHQPHNLAAIEILGRLKPELPQIACFDTAFHASLEPLFTTYALPQDLRDKGIRRYGFHGLSYEWIAQVLRRDHPELARGRVIAAHLGNGASLCAMKNGQSIDTTMGFTTLEGPPMGTRSGSLDPGALLYMLRQLGLSADVIEHRLNEESGLKGLSGTTNDVKALLQSADPRAQFALDYFALKVAQFAAQMAVSLGGAEAMVFTGGIGENAAPIREAVLKHLSFLGSLRALVLPANEERMIAMYVAAQTVAAA